MIYAVNCSFAVLASFIRKTAADATIFRTFVIDMSNGQSLFNLYTIFSWHNTF